MNPAEMEEQLRKLMAGTNVNIQSAKPNADFPILGEKFTQLKPGNREAPDPKGDYWLLDISNEKGMFHDSEDFFLPGLQKYHFQTLQLYRCADDVTQCRKKCRQLIATSQDRCAEVHNLLALLSDTLEDALEEFLKARAVGEATINWKMSVVREAVELRDYWDAPGLRAYQRAQVGIALTLCKLKRWEEARVEYEKLHTKMDFGAPKQWSSYINWRYHYPLVLIMCNRPRDALNFMTQYKDCYSLQSTSLAWCWNTAFCQYKLKQLDGIDVRYWEVDLQSIKGQETPVAVNVRMLQANAPLWKYFLSHAVTATGEEPKPLELPYHRIPREVNSEELEAAVYWNRHREMWLSEPDIYETVLRVRNRFSVEMLFMPDKRGVAFTQNPGLLHAPVDLKKLDDTLQVMSEFLDSGSDTRYIPNNCIVTNLVTAPGVPKQNAAYYLVELGRHGYPMNTTNGMGLTPLNVACYYGTNGEGDGAVVAALMRLGADPWKAAEGQQSPAYMAAYRGNWMLVKTVLNYYEELPTRLQLSGMFLQSVLGRRCSTNKKHCMQDKPIDKKASFEKVVEILVAYGLKPEDATLDNNVIRMSGIDTSQVTGDPLYNLLRSLQSKGAELQHWTECDESLVAPIEPLRRCLTCGSIKFTLKLCSRCKKVHYCSRRCQVVDWKNHKAHCT